MAYIRGYKEWLSLRILTDPRALIPRPETELLAETAMDEIAGRLVRDDAPIAAWEVATGSGAVALAWRCASARRWPSAGCGWAPVTRRPRRSSWRPRTLPRTGSPAW